MPELVPGALKFNFLRQEGGPYFVYQFLASKWHYLYFYLKPNCNMKIQKPYRKLPFEPYRPYTSRTCISYRVPKHIFSGGWGRGTYLRGGAYYKFWTLGGALIRRGALIWSWALIRAFTVYNNGKRKFCALFTPCTSEFYFLHIS